MTDIRGTGLVEGLPPIVAEKPWVKVLDAVYRHLQLEALKGADRLQIYTNIDGADEDVLDVLAVQWKVDWYDTSYSLETKRSIIKSALEVRRYYGTEWATLKAISAVYPDSEIVEWYDYGGTPGHFKVICSQDTALEQVNYRAVRKCIDIYKRETAHLDGIVYTMDDVDAVGYVAATRRAQVMRINVKVTAPHGG